MLVLTRKVGERLVIGEDIVVTVAEIKGDNVRLAIEAPKSVKIYRGELYEAIAAENRLAAGATGETGTAGLAELQKMLEKK